MSLLTLPALLLGIVATARAAITLHPDGDTAFCLDARGDASNSPTNPVKAFTRPCEFTGGYPVPPQVFDWRGSELRLDETDPPRCVRDVDGLAALGSCEEPGWSYDDAFQVIRQPPDGDLCLDPGEKGGQVTVVQCELCPPVMAWTVTEL